MAIDKTPGDTNNANGSGTSNSLLTGAMSSTTGAAGGAVAATETAGFLAGMTALTAESNAVQIAMGNMNLSKTLNEGLAKFIKESGKGFTMP